MTKYKYLLFLAFLNIYLFSSANLVLALEVDFGLPPDANLFDYAAFIFAWSMSIAGILALISFAIGAVGFIVSGDNPELTSSSRDRMKGAILGLVLTLSSLIIIRTINPGLLSPLKQLGPATPPTTELGPGIYYFPEHGCTGKRSGPYIYSQDEVSKTLGKISSIEIRDDPEKEIYYGAIFHQTTGLLNSGQCTMPLTSEEGCSDIDEKAKIGASTIFQINKGPNPSGDGVTFYSEPFGWKAGQEAGFFKVHGYEIDSSFWKASSEEMFFSYEGVNRWALYRSLYKTFYDASGSIYIDGDFVVAVYKDWPSAVSFFTGGIGVNCQTFTKSVESLKSEGSILKGDTIGKVYIIPTIIWQGAEGEAEAEAQ